MIIFLFLTKECDREDDSQVIVILSTVKIFAVDDNDDIIMINDDYEQTFPW